MKLLTIILALLLCASPVLAEEPLLVDLSPIDSNYLISYPGKTTVTLEDPYTVAWMNPAVLGGGGGAAGCDVATNFVGNKDAAQTLIVSGGQIYCDLRTPDCSGKIYKGYLHHRTTNPDEGKIFIYSDLGTAGTPDASDLLIAYTTGITSSTNDQWVSADLNANPSVSTGSNYWVCIAATGSYWLTYHQGSQTSKINTCDAGCYGTPPSTLEVSQGGLGSSWSSSASKGAAGYATIGN